MQIMPHKAEKFQLSPKLKVRYYTDFLSFAINKKIAAKEVNKLQKNTDSIGTGDITGMEPLIDLIWDLDEIEDPIMQPHEVAWRCGPGGGLCALLCNCV